MFNDCFDRIPGSYGPRGVWHVYMISRAKTWQAYCHRQDIRPQIAWSSNGAMWNKYGMISKSSRIELMDVIFVLCIVEIKRE